MPTVLVANKPTIGLALTGQSWPGLPLAFVGESIGFREYRQLDANAAAKAGFCFTAEGVPFTIHDVQDAARNQFQDYVLLQAGVAHIGAHAPILR